MISIAEQTQKNFKGFQFIDAIVNSLNRARRQPNFIFTFFTIFLFSCYRASDIIINPSFWAEDSTFFLKEVFELGPLSIITPVVGHYHTIPRILMYIGTFFGTKNLPLFIILTAGVISSASFAYFIRDGFSWIVETKWLRFIVALLISCLPGSEEIIFAYCTMNYVFFIWITLFFLEHYEGNTYQKVFRELLFSTIWFSSGQSIVFLPIYFYEFFKKNWIKTISFLTLILSVYLNWSAANKLKIHTDNAHSIDFEKLIKLLTVYFDNIFMRYLYRPILNTELSQWVSAFSSPIFYLISLLLLLFIFFVLIQSKNYKPQGDFKSKFLLLMLITPGVFPLTFLVRGYTTKQLFRSELYYIGRYAIQPFLISFIMFILICKVLPNLKPQQKLFKLALGLLLFVNYFQYDLRFTKDPVPDFYTNWPQFAEQIDLAIKKVRVNKISPAEVINGPLPCRPTWWKSGLIEINIRPF